MEGGRGICMNCTLLHVYFLRANVGLGKGNNISFKNFVYLVLRY